MIDLLKRYCQIDDSDDARTGRGPRCTGQVLTLDATLQDTLPALLALLDAVPEDSPFLQLDPSQRRQRLLQALKRVLLRKSQVRPLLLVVEDLHWIDAETQALLDSLVERLPTARLLLLVNYRPEYRHGWGSKSYYTPLRLDPLPPVSADELLQALLGDDASLEPLTQLLIARTEGNPFFLEENVRTLVETGVLVGTPGAYRLAQAMPSIQVPATVQAVLAARIDRLPLEENAAADGRRDWDRRALRPAAGHCGRARGGAASRPRAPASGRVPVYDLPVPRAGVHLQACPNARGGLRQPPAGAAASAACAPCRGPRGPRARAEGRARRTPGASCRAGEVWDKAVTYCQQAGAKAVAHAANREAVAYLEQALTALHHLPETQATGAQAIDLLLDLRYVLLLLGDLGKVLQYLHKADSHAERLHDHRRRGWVAAYMSYSFWWRATMSVPSRPASAPSAWPAEM